MNGSLSELRGMINMQRLLAVLLDIGVPCGMAFTMSGHIYVLAGPRTGSPRLVSDVSRTQKAMSYDSNRTTNRVTEPMTFRL